MDSLLFLFFIAPLMASIATWWLGRQFWKQSSAHSSHGNLRFYYIAKLVLLSILLNLLLYGVSAIFFLPWINGPNSKSPTPYDWQEAHAHHEVFVLAISGLCGALVLLLWWRWRAAISWFVGCALVVICFRSQRAYANRPTESEEPREQLVRGTTFSTIDSLDYVKLQTYYDADGNSIAASSLSRWAIPYGKLAQKPVFPGGDTALQAAIQRRLRYPWAARRLQAPVDISVECIVETTGQLTVLYTSAAPPPAGGLGYEQEAMRAARNLPPFIPGQQNGQPVVSTYTVNIPFRPKEVSTKQMR